MSSEICKDWKTFTSSGEELFLEEDLGFALVRANETTKAKSYEIEEQLEEKHKENQSKEMRVYLERKRS